MSEFRLNRIFSRPLSRMLLATPATPNLVTSACLALGLGAGAFLATGRYGASVAGAFMYQLAVILDNCDGEIARAKNLGSVFGAWFDIVVDLAIDFSLFGGTALGMARRGHPGPAALLAVLCLSGCFMHFVLVVIEKLKGFGPAAYGAPHPEASTRRSFWLTLFDALREGDGSWFVPFFAVIGQMSWLLWIGAPYLHVIWISAVAVNYRWLFSERAS